MLKLVSFIFLGVFYVDLLGAGANENDEFNTPVVRQQLSVQSLSQELMLLKAQESYITNLLEEVKETKDDGKNFITVLGQLGLFKILTSSPLKGIQQEALKIAGGADIQKSLFLTSIYVRVLEKICLHFSDVFIENEEKLKKALVIVADDLGRSVEKSREDIYHLAIQYVLSQDDRFIFGISNQRPSVLGWKGPLDGEDYHNIGKKFSDPLRQLLSLPRDQLDASDLWTQFNPVYGDHPVLGFYRNECLSLLKIEKIIRSYLGPPFQVYLPQDGYPLGSLSYSIDKIHRYTAENFKRFLNFVANPPKKSQVILKRLLNSYQNLFLLSSEKTKKLATIMADSLLDPLEIDKKQEIDTKSRKVTSLGHKRKKTRKKHRKSQYKSLQQRMQPSISLLQSEEGEKEEERQPRKFDKGKERDPGQVIASVPVRNAVLQKEETQVLEVNPSFSKTEQEQQEDDSETFDFQAWYQDYIAPYHSVDKHKVRDNEKLDELVVLPALPRLSGKALKFYKTVFGQGYQELKIRDFNAFLRQAGGKKLRLTRTGYQPLKLEANAVEIFYTVPNISHSFKDLPFMLFKVHQPHPPRLPFPRKTLYSFIRKDLIKAGYGLEENRVDACFSKSL